MQTVRTRERIKVTAALMEVLEHSASPPRLGELIRQKVDENVFLKLEEPIEEEEPESGDMGDEEDPLDHELERDEEFYADEDIPFADMGEPGGSGWMEGVEELSLWATIEMLSEQYFEEEDLLPAQRALSALRFGDDPGMDEQLNAQLGPFIREVLDRIALETRLDPPAEPFLYIGSSREDIDVYDPPEVDHLRMTEERELRQALPEEYREATNLIYAIYSHKDYLHRLASEIVRRQQAFFEAPTFTEAAANLKPLQQEELARRVGVNASTISRLISGKYVRTCFGTVPLRFLCPRKPRMKKAPRGSSTAAIYDALMDIIDHEDKTQPYSDRQIAELLRERGYRVSRETVSDMRERLGIGNSRQRKIRG